jgi:hypothetical protein
MLNADIRPSTIEGIKSLAAQIKKERGIQHSNALDIAAVAARCSNFTHALRVLPSREQPRRVHRVFLTIYWYDRDPYRSGRETLQVELSKPILDICTKSELREVRGFGNMRMVAEDHFVSDSLAGSQAQAQETICKAVRSLRFMEHSGLRPSRNYRAAYPNRSNDSRLPGTDHATNWYDPATKQFVLVDEPYGGDGEERVEWAKTYGWHFAKSAWPGMYSPYSCAVYIATRASAGFDFAELMRRIDAIPAPIVQEGWGGESASSHDVFVSPAARTKQDIRRARSRGTVIPTRTRTTIPYSQMFGHRRRRPAGSLPVAKHIETGRLIKAVLGSPARPYSAYRRLDSLRCTLEDWMALEIGRGQLDGPEFFDVYYHELADDDPLCVAAAEQKGVIEIIDKIAFQLSEAYPDCAPLRRELNKLAVSKRLTLGAKLAGCEAARVRDH